MRYGDENDNITIDKLGDVIDKYASFLETIPLTDKKDLERYNSFLNNVSSFRAFKTGEANVFDFNSLKKNVSFFFHADKLPFYLVNSSAKSEEFIDSYAVFNGSIDTIERKQKNGTFYYQPEKKQNTSQKKSDNSGQKRTDYDDRDYYQQEFEDSPGFFRHVYNKILEKLLKIPNDNESYFSILNRFEEMIQGLKEDIQVLNKTISFMLKAEQAELGRYNISISPGNLSKEYYKNLSKLQFDYQTAEADLREEEEKKRQIIESYRPQIDHYYNNWLLERERAILNYQNACSYYNSIYRSPNQEEVRRLYDNLQKQEQQIKSYYTDTRGVYERITFNFASQHKDFQTIQANLTKLGKDSYEKQMRFFSYRDHPEQAMQEIKTDLTQKYYREKNKKENARKRKIDKKTVLEDGVVDLTKKKTEFIRKYQITYDPEGFKKRTGVDPNNPYGNTYQNYQGQNGYNNQGSQGQRQGRRR